MNITRLQGALDQLLSTTKQRWVLVLIMILAIVTPAAVMAMTSDFTDTWVVVLVAVLAMVVAAEPDEQLGLVLMGMVLFHWMTIEQSVTSPWSVALAGSLHVFHSTVALMAVTPHTAVVHRLVLLRWLGRSLVVGMATIAVWLLVVAFERQEAPGNVSLSAMALAVLSASVVGFRTRTLDGGQLETKGGAS